MFTVVIIVHWTLLQLFTMFIAVIIVFPLGPWGFKLFSMFTVLIILQLTLFPDSSLCLLL